MSFYSGLAAAASKLIKDKGRSMSLNVTAVAAYNTATSAAVVAAPAVVACFGVVLDFPAKEINGTTILSTDKKVILSVEGVAQEPKTFGSMTIGGLLHEIITCKTLAPAGIAVIYTLQVRSGG